MPSDRPNPTVSADDAVRRWLSHAWAATVDRFRGGPSPLSVYAFGKHPAFADFIDVARLPPVPAAFRHFHDHVRTAVERDGGPTEPTLIAWCERGDSAALWVQPSRDRGDGATGHFRRCPLLLGVTARCPLATLLAFGGRLANLADAVMSGDAEAVFERINRAAAEWPTAFGTGGRNRSGDPATRAVEAVGHVAGPVVVVADSGRAAAEHVGLSAGTLAALQQRLAPTAAAPDGPPGPRRE